MGEGVSLFLAVGESLFFNSNRDNTRGLEEGEEGLIAPGSLDIIRAAVCFALESAIIGREVARGRRS